MVSLTEFENKLKKEKVDSALVQFNNSLIMEYYRNPKMKEKQHKIYSVTKSILSTLIGIAIDKGYIESVNKPIHHYFQEFNKDSEFQRITIKHLLTMTSGLHWPGNNGMIPSKNWVNFVLDQAVVHPPGKEMAYSCGSSHLLSAIIQKATGVDTEIFAKHHLFTPLGITDYKWNRDAQGIAIGGFGITMKTVDMLKIGRLYLKKGRWKSQQIVSSQWVKESTYPRVKIDENNSYSYHWWNKTFNKMGRVFLASGYEGQYIIVAPDYQLVVVMTSSIKDDAARPLYYFQDYLVPYIINQ
ncbi:serine hydrolase domain-containing protein [Oceanobacillus picturae]|uniref:serine hydrolase domain-containing protein n=1 Tax=Oceanobacillus picturae TaxID=171693 RepID=UPI000E68CE9E|nr:serine hydrolase [Oceanobacillus picturae]RIU92048.1 class C beta-lactamase-related serine hydrolase [Oceanobacillus picturae]